jgi:hypothetical protein
LHLVARQHTAVGGAALGYGSVKLLWRLRVWLKRRTRRAGPQCSS